MNARIDSEATAFDDFQRVVDPTVYRPVPDDWVLGLTDVTDSTGAIAAGRYKAVNMAGAAGITAVMNALDKAPFPFIFGGDGAAFAVPPEHAETARTALAATARWVEDNLGLDLRTAIVPIEEIRHNGHDVRVAWYAASDAVRYAVFSGGGLAWAESQMKARRYLLEPASEIPILDGLSCRWNHIAATHGVILSLIVRPLAGADPAVFAKLVGDILALIPDERGGHPVPAEGPDFGWPPRGVAMEARTARPDQSPLVKRIRAYGESLLAVVLEKTGRTLGAFDPKHYRRMTAQNTDFRKYDDGLRMTVDCDRRTVDAITRRLEVAAKEGVAEYGLHTQTEALMTCIVPSALRDDHLHFLDGAGGGYAEAARHLK